jgi:hypothetical protein
MTKLFISLNEQSGARQSWLAAASRLGVQVVGYIDGAHILPLGNNTAQRASTLSGVSYMDVPTFGILSDCVARASHLPAMPAVQSEADVLAMTGPVFVKPRLNLSKGRSPLAYSRWGSGAALHAAAWQDFGTSELALGGLVAVPDLGNPMTNIELDFSVNAASEVYVMHTFTHGFGEHNRPTNMVSGATAPSELVSAISSFCAQRGIKGGVFNVQAAQHEGVWKIMDWNARPSGMYGVAAGVHPGVADAGLAHMLGLPVQSTPVHIELRSYWGNPIPNDRANEVRAHGLIPSWVWSRESIGRVYGIGDTQAEVQAKFNALEASLA